MNTPEPFPLASQRLGRLPIVNFFLTRWAWPSICAPTCPPTTPG